MGVKRIVLFLLVLAIGPRLMAQEERVVDGRAYLVHTVEAGQTLFAISQHYAVPVQSLLDANPAAVQGLSIGQVVLVPKDAIQKKEAKKAPTLLRDGELLHTAARKETLFGIAKRYNVEVNDLLERNPELNAGLQEGMTIVIPAGKSTGLSVPVSTPAVADDAIFHTVAAGETLYALGKRYGVGPEEITAANGGLVEGLKVGEVIRIPMAVKIAEEPRPIRADSITHKEQYRIALLLPFALQHNDSVQARASDKVRFHSTTRAAMQFHAGALLALDSLEALGLNAEVVVHDVGEADDRWTPVLKDPGLRDMDLFIGPFHRQAIELLARQPGDGTIICPVPQSNKVILGQPQVCKAVGGTSDVLATLGRFVAVEHARDNIILVCPDIFAEKEQQDQLLRVLQGALFDQPTRLRDSVRVVRTGRRDASAVMAKIMHDGPNAIVVPSDDVEFLFNLIGKLKTVADKDSILFYAMPGLTSSESISPLDLEELHYRTALDRWVDHGSLPVQRFTRAYRDRYHNDPGEYSFLGFDIMFYYGLALLEQGSGFADRFPLVHNAPLHMGFRMERTGLENGQRNSSVFVVEQRGLELRKIR